MIIRTSQSLTFTPATDSIGLCGDFYYSITVLNFSPSKTDVTDPNVTFSPDDPSDAGIVEFVLISTLAIYLQLSSFGPTQTFEILDPCATTFINPDTVAQMTTTVLLGTA